MSLVVYHESTPTNLILSDDDETDQLLDEDGVPLYAG
jgi:hypothetical protein